MLMSLPCLRLTIVCLFKCGSPAGRSVVAELGEETWRLVSDVVLDVSSGFILWCFTFTK